MKGFLFFSQAFALLYGIQKKGYFIYIEADDFFIVQLWEPDESCRVYCKLFCSKKIIIKALKSIRSILAKTGFSFFRKSKKTDKS